MRNLRRKLWLAVLAGGLILGFGGAVEAAAGKPAAAVAGKPAAAATSPGVESGLPPAAVVKRKSTVWSAAELGFGGSVIADGVTFLGPVLTVQGGHYRPLVGVFQMGAGVALYKDPIPDQIYAATDPKADPTESNAMFYVGLGLRVRIFQFLASLRDKPFDLYMGPLAMVFGNHDLVTFGVAGEVGFAMHLGRVRISLSVHGGYQSVMHQYANAQDYEFAASYVLGGQVSAGVQF
jgi:hypothetical protein